jgi:phenylacetate-CoA ligase
MILRCASLSPHYEIEITRPNRLDEIRIVVEARTELDDAAKASEAALLSAKLKDHIGISAQVHVAASGSLPRSEGKAMHVRDLR